MSYVNDFWKHVEIKISLGPYLSYNSNAYNYQVLLYLQGVPITVHCLQFNDTATHYLYFILQSVENATEKSFDYYLISILKELLMKMN